MEKLHAPVSSLSGGQKRKLSLSIAFLGNPKVRSKGALNKLLPIKTWPPPQ